MSDETFYLTFDYEKCAEKPKYEPETKYADKYGNKRSHVQVIGTRIASGARNVSQRYLENSIQNGITWMGSVYAKCPQWGKRRRLESLWESMSAIVVDFDNNPDVETIFRTIRSCGMDFSIFHKTFSWKPDFGKYRGIILLDEPITDKRQAYESNFFFESLFRTEYDSSCKDLARLFYGGRPNCVTYSSDYRTSYRRYMSNIGESIKNKVSSVKFSKGTSSNNSFARDLSRQCDDGDYKGLESQRSAIQQLSRIDQARIMSKIKREMEFLQTYNGQCSSRYLVLWNASRALGMIPVLYYEAVEMWLTQAITSNSYWDDWDKSIPETIATGFEYGRNNI